MPLLLCPPPRTALPATRIEEGAGTRHTANPDPRRRAAAPCRSTRPSTIGRDVPPRVWPNYFEQCSRRAAAAALRRPHTCSFYPPTAPSMRAPPQFHALRLHPNSIIPHQFRQISAYISTYTSALDRKEQQPPSVACAKGADTRPYHQETPGAGEVSLSLLRAVGSTDICPLGRAHLTWLASAPSPHGRAVQPISGTHRAALVCPRRCIDI